MHAPAIDVIVPVYRGLTLTRDCLESLLDAPCATAFQVLVVDDASPEPEITALLDELARAGRILLLRNARNLGFPASVNRALRQHPERDAVVLNSDTRVFPGWLDRLARAAWSAPDIGTATPFSNNATICSYPRFNTDNPLPPDISPQALDALFASRNAGRTVDIPTAVGFCMYMRRDCLNDAGLLDEATFGHGYGEENDFCIRSARLGWRHVLAGDVFVFHAGGASFGTGQKPALERNLARLDARHPRYMRRVQDFLRADPVLPLRRSVDVARLDAQPRAPLVVRLCHALSGGTARRLREEAQELAAQGVRSATLAPLDKKTPDRVRLRFHDAPDCPNLVFDLPGELDLLTGLLAAQGASLVRLHHFMGFNPCLLELAARLGLPHDVVVHDYAWFCPRVNCIDDSGLHCPEPDPDACQRCVDVCGQDPAMGPRIAVRDLLARSGAILGSARAVITPSQDAAARILSHFPGCAVQAVAHTEAPFAPPPPPPAWNGRSPLRLAVLGAIGQHKGYDVLLACARDAALRGLPLEYRVVGFTADDMQLMGTGRAHVTGKFREAEVQDLLARQRCHAALFLSVWPETWCYTLTQAWRAGLWAIGFDIGAVGERIRQTGLGWLMPLTRSGAAVNDQIMNMLARPGG